MAAKKNYLQKNEAQFSKLLLAGLAFILMALIIPGIGYEDALTSPAYWVSTVDFFTTVRDHLSSFWMFYTIALALLFAYLRSPKK